MSRFLRLLLLIFFMSCSGSGLFGIRIGRDIRKATESIDRAVDELDSISDDWQIESDEWKEILVSLQEELDSDFSRYIDQIEDMVFESQRLVFNMTACVSQYFIESLIFELEQMRNDLTGGVKPSIVDQVPVSERLILCVNFIDEIYLSSEDEDEDERFKWPILGYFGPLGSDMPDLRIMVVDHDGTRGWPKEEGPEEIITRGANNQVNIDISKIYRSGYLFSAHSIEIIDWRKSRILATYLIKP